MKIKALLLAALASFGAAQGAVTLQFSSTTTYVGGFQNGDGSINGAAARMVWGVIVDGDGDGLDANGVTTNYASGFSLATNQAGTALTLVGGAATDDRIYIATAVMAQNGSAVDGAAIGDNRILAFSNLAFGGTAGAGDRFYVVWFNATALGGNAADGLRYGTLSDAAFILPSDGSTTPYGEGNPSFTGADPSKPLTGVIGVPEPSVALLGVLGLFGFLRRRR